MLRKLPIIVILGSTGTGKTKLSIELAQRFGGEVISADSMQVYRGLNVVTAKATPAEQKQVPHHMLDICEPGKEFNVVNFRDQALPIVNHLLEKSKIPIIVGGTNYYIESLLWQVLVSDATPAINTIDTKDDSSNTPDDKDINGCTLNKKLKLDNLNNQNNSTINDIAIDELHQLDSLRLHEILTTVDPDTAKRLHPNNRRKTIRALEVFKNGGTKLSDIIYEQRQLIGGSHLGGPLRYKHVILFWLRCDQEILSERLDNRIADMVRQGLLNEIRTFYKEFLKNDDTRGGGTGNFDKGILQTIGFKEFIPYLENFTELDDKNITEFMINKSQVDSGGEDSAAVAAEQPNGMKELELCLAELSLVTKRYSKKQLKWIRNRFLTSSSREVPDIYGLDTSNVQNWQENVYVKAEHIVSSYINEEQCTIEPLKRENSLRLGLNEEITNFCDRCDRRFIGEYQWQIHLKSNKHKKAYRKMGQITKIPKTNV